MKFITTALLILTNTDCPATRHLVKVEYVTACQKRATSITRLQIIADSRNVLEIPIMYPKGRCNMGIVLSSVNGFPPHALQIYN